MSTTITPSPASVAVNMAGNPTTKTDQVLNSARDFPDMLSKAEQFDPPLASKWTGKAILASKTVWGTAVALIVAAAVKRYSLGWDQNFVDLVSGLIVLGTVAGLRAISDGPITGWFTKKTVAEVVASTPGVVAPVRPGVPTLMLLIIAGTLLPSCTAQTTADAILIAADALPCYEAVLAATQSGSNAVKGLTAANVLATTPACAAVTQATAQTIAAAITSNTPVTTGAVTAMPARRI